MGVGGAGSGKRVGEGILFHQGKTTRKSHFSQCINLPKTDGRGGERRMEEEGEEEIQKRIK